MDAQLANAERYITPELKELLRKYGAEEKNKGGNWNSIILLNELWIILSRYKPMYGNLLAAPTVFADFAQISIQTIQKPQLHTGDEWIVKEGRHL